MNTTHVHLLINHLPVFGSILGAIVLGYALLTKSNPTKMAAYMIFVISALGAVVAFLTGEAAEHTVEKIQGIAKGMLEEHEDAADFALGAMIGLGVFSIAGMFLTIRKSALTKGIAIITLLVSLFSFSVVARTAYLGGLIRHTEISDAQAQPVQEEEEADEDHD